MPLDDRTRAKIAAALQKARGEAAPQPPGDPLKVKIAETLKKAEDAPSRTARFARERNQREAADILTSQGFYRPTQVALPTESEGVLLFGNRGVTAVGKLEAERRRFDPADPMSAIFDAGAPRAPAPKNKQLSDVLSALSVGRLRLPADAISEERLSEFRLREQLKFQQQTPRIAGMVPQKSSNSLNEFMAVINHQPPTPDEQREILEFQRQDWASAIGAGTAAFGLGANETRAQELAAMPADLFQNVASKILGNPDQGQDLLQTEGPYGDERAAFRTLSPGFFRFAEEKRQFYTARNRLLRLTGADPTPELRQGVLQTNLFDAVPDTSIFTVNNLSPAFPSLQEIQRQASQMAEAEARAQAGEAAQVAQLPPTTQAGINLDRAGGPLGLASRAGQTLLEWLDTATAHLISASIHKLDSALNTAAPYQQLKASIVRDRLQGLEAGDTAEAEYARLLQDFPDLEPERARFLAGKEIFTARRLAGSLPEQFQKQFQLDLPAALGMTDGAFREVMDAWAGFFDEPGAALVALGVLPSLRAKAKRLLRTDVHRAESTMAALDEAGVEMREVASDLRAKMLDRQLTRIRQTALDPGQAQAMFQKLTDKLGESGLGLSPEVIGKFRAGIEDLQRLDRKAHTRRSALERSIGRTQEAVRAEGGAEAIFDSFMVMEPGGRPAIDPAHPSVLMEGATSFVRSAADAFDVVDSPGFVRNVPRGRDNRAFKRYEEAVHARVTDNLERRESAGRHVRARDILKDVDREIELTIEELRASRQDVTDQISLELREHNSGLRTAIARAAQLEHDGGVVLEANPALASAKYRRAAHLAKSPEAAMPFLFSERGGRQLLNKRGIRDIGGPELLQEIQTIFRESEQLEGTVTSAARSEAANLLANAADAFKRATERPIERGVPPKSQPRTKAIQEMIKKAEEAIEKGSPIKLTPAELTILNEYRPGNAQLRLRYDQRNQTYLRTQRSLDRRISAETDLRERIARMVDKIENLTPGTIRNFRIPKRLHEAVERRLAEDTTGFFTPRHGFSLTDGMTVLRGDLALWRDLAQDLPQEVRLLRRQVLNRSSLELATLPESLLTDFASSQLRANLRMRNEHLRQAAAVIQTLNRDVPHSQRILITESIRNGKVDPRLPKDAAEYVINKMRQIRNELLDTDAISERIPPRLHSEWANERYVPDTYLRDPDVRAEAQGSALADISPTEQLRLATIDGRHFRFKRPEDSFWVEWKDRGQARHEKGFKTPAEAQRWAEVNLRGKKFNVKNPETRLEKIARGLQLDPGAPFGELVKDWTQDQALYVWQRTLAQMPTTLRGADVRAMGATPGEIQRGQVRLGKDGTEYIRVTDRKMPHLHGKWVPTKMVMGAAEAIAGGPQFLENIIAPWKALADGGAAKFKTVAGKVIGGSNNMLATTHVTMNPMSYMRGWWGNTVYAHLAGFSMMNPLNWVRLLDYMAETARAVDVRAWKRTARELDINELLSSDRLPVEVRWLVEDNIINIGENVFDNAMRSSRRIAEGPKALASKVQDLEARIARLEPNDPNLPAAADRLGKLQDQLRDAAGKGIRDFVTGFAKAVGRELEGGRDTLGVQRLWSSYTWGSGDIPMKIAAAMHLHRVKGWSRDQILKEIRARFQIFHEPQQWVGKAAFDGINKITGNRRNIGGVLFMGFKSEQARIIAGALKERKSEIAQLFAAQALWNTMQIRGSGRDLEGFLNSHALDMQVERGFGSDALALLGQVIVGHNEDGSLQAIPGDPLFGTWFASPYGGIGERVSEMAQQNSTNANWKVASEVLGGTVGGLVLANAPAQILTSIIARETPRGTPVGLSNEPLKNLFRAFVREPFLPPLLGGTDTDRLARTLKGRDIDPQTFQAGDFDRFAAERLIGLRRIKDPWRQVNSAIRYWQTHNDERLESDRIAREHRDDTLFAKVARGAIDPRTGRIADPALHRQIVREHLAGSGKRVVAPGGKVIETDVTDHEAITRSVERTRNPRIVTRFNETATYGQVQVYALWRAANPNLATQAHRDVDRKLRGLIVSKIETGRMNDAQLQLLGEASRSARESKLPNDAKRFLRGVIQLVLEEEQRRRR